MNATYNAAIDYFGLGAATSNAMKLKSSAENRKSSRYRHHRNSGRMCANLLQEQSEFQAARLIRI